MRYAQKTKVSRDRSRAEIERTLQRYGADSFMYGWEENRALVGFRMNERTIRFILPMPSREDPEFTHTPTGKPRAPSAGDNACEQAKRQRWRALELAVKAKLEVVETGIRTFEQEFGLDMVMPDGRTVGEHVMPEVQKAIATGRCSRLLPTFAAHGID